MKTLADQFSEMLFGRCQMHDQPFEPAAVEDTKEGVRTLLPSRRD